MSQKVAFYTLGCKLNYSETSTISRIFENRGYTKVDFGDTPDIFIINTCSVTENADKKCKKVVHEAKKISPNSFVAIIGCYAQLKPEEIANIKGVNAVLGASEKFRLIDILDGFDRNEFGKIYSQPIENATDFNSSYSINDRTRTFLKVQDGCDYTCSFCTIPLARGSSRSEYIKNILSQAVEIGTNGVKEIVLTGVNIGDFGIHDGNREESFLDLLKELDETDFVPNRLRISSIEPNLLTDEIIEFVSRSNRLVPHFHIPLQSGSNKILGLMRRRYKKELYKSRIDKIKSLMPNACIGVDVITGFPGENDEDFKTTYDFLNELDISYLHVFTYSERDHTNALTLKEVVPQKARNERTTMLRSLSEKKRRAFYESQIGKDESILFESDIENGMMTGFSRNYVKVKAKYDPILVGEEKMLILKEIDFDGNMLVEDSLEVMTH